MQVAMKVKELEKEEAKAAQDGDYTRAGEIKKTIAAWNALSTAAARAQLDSGGDPPI